MLRGLGFLLNPGVLGVMSIQGGAERRQPLAGFRLPEALGGSIMPAVVHRSDMLASRLRLTLRQTWRSAFLTEMWRCLGRRSRMLRALWIWQR
jgi:hypothetical protein